MEFVLDRILRPSLDRIASQLAMAFAAFGVGSGDIETLTAAFAVLGGLIIDFVIRRLGK